MQHKHFVNGPVVRDHYTRPSISQLKKICDDHDLHELVREDVIEYHTQDKIDVYDDHLFLVLHFPKYSLAKKKYLLNEFNIVIKHNTIISFSTQPTNEIQRIATLCEQIMQENIDDHEERHIISPYFIVYRLLDGMYNKALLSLRKFTTDLIDLEEEIFDTDHIHKDLLENLMIKRRNSIFLKHTFIPHDEIMEELHNATVKLFAGELDVYFEDLQYKIDRINYQIQ